ncbi:SET domain-containing protein-lysine N-methyltransferase [Candidatus Dependentiae bacterium]|nr:SET domain-containing protein-lysine N-methyltransferase [Candidatus Dependentiae bacterium]
MNFLFNVILINLCFIFQLMLPTSGPTISYANKIISLIKEGKRTLEIVDPNSKEVISSKFLEEPGYYFSTVHGCHYLASGWRMKEDDQCIFGFAPSDFSLPESPSETDLLEKGIISESLKKLHFPHVEIKYSNPQEGFGAFSAEQEKIPAGTIIAPYTGIVSISEPKDHMMYGLKIGKIIIDAQAAGNVTRFMNHREDPNAEIKLVFNKVTKTIHPCIVAKKSIERGEQVCWSYGEKYWQNLKKMPYNPSDKTLLQTTKHLLISHTLPNQRRMFSYNNTKVADRSGSELIFKGGVYCLGAESFTTKTGETFIFIVDQKEEKDRDVTLTLFRVNSQGKLIHVPSARDGFLDEIDQINRRDRSAVNAINASITSLSNYIQDLQIKYQRVLAEKIYYEKYGVVLPDNDPFPALN